jgi:hypothetical protein
VTATEPIRVTRLAEATGPGRLGAGIGRHGPSAPYAQAVWLPVLGPASFLVWQRLARTALHRPGTTTDREELAAAVGLGSPHGAQSAVNRALRRLERFGIVRWEEAPGVLEVRCRLPDVGANHLYRLHPGIQIHHHRLRRTGT